MIPKVEVILGKVGTGVTEPLHGIIDNNHVIIKTFNNEESNRVLINEFVSHRMAKALSLPIPDGGICLIDKQTKIDESLCFQEERYGLGFYTKRLDKVTNIVSSPLLLSKYIANKDDFIKIILFDNLIYNKDRHKGNVLINIGKKGNNKLYIIDHTHVFNIGALWDKYQLKRMIDSEDYNSDEVMQYNEAVYNLLIEAITIDKDGILKLAENFKTILSKDFLQNLVRDIPDVWNIDEEEKTMLFNYLFYRVKNIENICNVIYNYIRNRSRRW
ncbi:HipA family kinase [Fonticella tunisiensis]|uniref:HipA-like kinase domain-containing protein n=1 Tax=Fonticella tunisiensis TaxID=1096341 RepID=A0A4R7KWS6_9CLOT|nr:HipA family kinase [Fonticella tunisiensis]TDT63440.1 hypothetical protein EDD71_102202 [Fonticella tunisiensis]